MQRRIMNILSSSILVATMLSVTLPALANGKFKFERINPITEQQELISYVDRESKIVIERMNNYLIVPEDVTVVFGANDGPLYDPETHEVFMPDEFILEVMQRFKDASYVKTIEELFNVTMDVIEHTLYHELGHALVELLQIPITAKEEDAVDSLATILVILTNKNGEEVALSAADLFDLEGEEIEELTDIDFWDEHSLDFQRFYNTICLIYGSQPDRYAFLIDELEITEERADLCIDDYQRESRSWEKLLKPYLKDKKIFH